MIRPGSNITLLPHRIEFSPVQHGISATFESAADTGYVTVPDRNAALIQMLNLCCVEANVDIVHV